MAEQAAEASRNAAPAPAPPTNGHASPRRSAEVADPAPRIVPNPNSSVTRRAPGVLALLLFPFSLIWKVLSGFSRLFGSLFPFLPRLLSPAALNRRIGPAGSGSSSRSDSHRKWENPRDTASRFIREFQEINGDTTLPFYEGGYGQALDAAKAEVKFLLVILQSDEHDDTATFNRETLSKPEVVRFIREHDILLWAGNVADAEAYQVSSALNCTKFPFAALIANNPSQGSTVMSVLTRITGPVPPTVFIARLTSSIAVHAPALTQVRTSRAAQEADRRIRLESESAYARSLAADQERTRQRQLAEQRAREEEDRVRRQAEEIEMQSLRRERWRKWRAARIPASDADVQGGARVSVRLRNGERAIRKFARGADIEDVYAFVECYDLISADGGADEAKPDGYEHVYNFRLVSPLPRKVFELNGGAVGDSGLFPSANLIVEPIEEDEDED